MKIRYGYVVNILLIVLMAVISFTPIISRNQPVYWIPFLFLAWCASAFILRPSAFSLTPFGPLFWTIMIIGWQAFLSVIGINDTNIWGHIAAIPKYGIVLFMYFVLSNYRIKEKILLMVLLSIIFIANVLFNDIYAFGHPEYYMGLNTNVLANTTNLGSTSMTVCCLFFFSVLLLVITETGLRRYRIISYVLLAIIGYYFFYLNSRGIAFFLSLLFIWEFLIAPFFSKRKHRVGYYILILIVAYLLYFLAISPILGYFVRLFAGNDVLVERFFEIQDFSSTGEGSGSLEGRLYLYTLSIRTWLSSIVNFVFGVGWHEYDSSMAGLTRSGVGHHSEFLDFLAYYGIIGGLILYKWLSMAFRFIIKRFHATEIYNKYIVVVVVFVLHGFLNNVLDSMDIIFMSLLIVPLFFDVINSTIYEHTA